MQAEHAGDGDGVLRREVGDADAVAEPDVIRAAAGRDHKTRSIDADHVIVISELDLFEVLELDASACLEGVVRVKL